MKNYKIKVNDLKIAEEVRDLFEQLGYGKSSFHDHKQFPRLILAKFTSSPYSTGCDISCPDADDCKELTHPQLRDLVVLHRNDLNDRTHVYTTSTGEELSAILLGDWWHIFTGGSWQKFTNKASEKSLLMDRIQPVQEQGLIGGAEPLSKVEAFEAWINGFDVEAIYENEATLIDADTPLDIFHTSHGFHLKPRTIKLELEIPAPFEPKVGEVYWFISSTHRDGYDFTEYEGTNTDHMFMLYGAFKSEQNIIAVRDALRGIKG